MRGQGGGVRALCADSLPDVARAVGPTRLLCAFSSRWPWEGAVATDSGLQRPHSVKSTGRPTVKLLFPGAGGFPGYPCSFQARPFDLVLSSPWTLPCVPSFSACGHLVRIGL